MRTFVLGAGASFHVGYPLTKNLGPKLMEFISHNAGPRNYPYWPNPDELKVYGSFEDIEGLVTNLEMSENPGTKLTGLREALSFYFDTIRESGAHLYRKFATEVIQSGDSVITFNYDVSLERELHSAGKWEITDGYGFRVEVQGIPCSSTKLLKLHGSTSWMSSLFDGLQGGKIQVGGSDSLGDRPVLLPKEFDFLGYPGMRDPRFKGGGMIRSNGDMVLMSRNKRFYVSTSSNLHERQEFWSDLWQQAEIALQGADEIVIIGYSVPPADKDARRLLFGESNKRSLVTICCGEDSNRLASEFVQEGFLQVRADSVYFDDWLSAECASREALAAE